MNARWLKHRQESFALRLRKLQKTTYTSLRKESPYEQEERIKFLVSPRNYGQFFDYYFGKNGGKLALYPCASFHKKAYKTLYAHPVIQQFRLWFRGAAKSLQTNVGNAFALKCNAHMYFMLLVGINQWRARLLLSDLQMQLQGNERIINDFGQQVSYGNWKEGMFETQDGCYFMALGMNQSFRGLRRLAHRIDFAVIDDVEDLKIATNPRRVQEYTDKIVRDLQQAFDRDRRRLVISNNLITHTGIIAKLLKSFANSKHTHISRVNILNEKNQPTWKTYFPKSVVMQKKKDLHPKTFANEYMNEPYAQETFFKESDITFAPRPQETPLGCVGFWDLSYTPKGDFKAMALVARYEEYLLVVNVFCRQCDLDEALFYHFRTAKKMRTETFSTLWYYDASFRQDTIYTPIIKSVAKQYSEYEIPLPHYEHRADKHLRIRTTLSHLLYLKHLRFDEKLKENIDLKKGIEQLLSFSYHKNSNDDFPDALESACYLCQKNIAKKQTPILSPQNNSRQHGF